MLNSGLGEFEIVAPVFDGGLYWGMIGIVLMVLAVVVSGLAKVFPGRKTWLVLAPGSWLAISAALAISGFLSNQDSGPLPVIMIPLLILLLSGSLAFSRFGKLTSERIGICGLVGIHVFRLPLELLMHQAYEKGLMPVWLSFEGLNFDIFTGIGALLLVIIWRCKGKVSLALVWIWNVYGIGCLLMIFYIALKSSPIFRGWGNEPENVNTWVLFFPYVWLPTVLVVIALAGHLVLTRKLLKLTSKHSN